jgi:polyhydroxybutyrate depolymerase
LVVLLHGSSFNGTRQMQVSRMRQVADRSGFIVAAPNGGASSAAGFAWVIPRVPVLGTPPPGGLPDDEGYVLDVVAHLQRVACADHRRVYATGYSGGARMISALACDHAEAFAAIAPVAGLRAGTPLPGSSRPAFDPATCHPRRPIPIIAFHGTADPVNPYAGGGPPTWAYSVPTAQRRWAELDHCRRGPALSHLTRTIRLVSYSHCRGGAEVLLYRITGGGHQWPGGTPLAQFGPTTQQISASELMSRFFAAHAIPRR